MEWNVCPVYGTMAYRRSRPLAAIHPLDANDSIAALPDVQKLVVSTPRAWVTFARHRKTDGLVDRFGSGFGPLKTKCNTKAVT